MENVGPAPKTKKNLFKWLEGKGRRVDVEIVIVKGWKMEDGKYGVGLTHFPPGTMNSMATLSKLFNFAFVPDTLLLFVLRL